MRRAVEWLMPNRLRRSYSGKLLLAVVLVALAIAVVGAGLYVHTGTILQERTQTELQSAAEIEAQALDEWIERMRLQTRTVAEANAFRTGDDSAVVQYLWSVVERDAEIEAAYFVDTTNGSVITSVGSSSILSAQGVIEASGQRDFTRRAHGEGEVFVSRPFRPYEGSAPVILLSSAVPNRSGRSVVTVVNLNQFSDSDGHRLDEAQFQVVNERGTVVMDENDERILTRQPGATRPESATGFTVAEYDGVESAVGYASLEQRNWTVTARMSTARAFQLRSAILEGVLVMIGVSVLGVGALAVVLSRSTIRPIRELTGKARELRKGSLAEPIESDRIDAWGELYASFDRMRASLKAQIERAQQSRQAAHEARKDAEQARHESEALTETLQREADQFGTVMAACADGDLDRRLEPSSESESMEEIAAAFNEMMDDVQAQNEQLEAFTSIVSHDLRNPLTVAYGRAKLIEEETDCEHVRPVLESIERMQSIIEDGLMLARGTRVEDPMTVDVTSHAERAWNHVAAESATLDARVEKEIQADPNLLEQAFENLFRNAIEHAGVDVTVRVSAEEWGFVVEDDGPGLPESDVENIFEPGVSDGSGGTGLGLTIVRRIADAHGWTVRPGNGDAGARFEFVLERTDRAPPMDERNEADESSEKVVGTADGRTKSRTEFDRT